MNKIVSILGPSSASPEILLEAEKLGRLLAENGICIQNGGYSGVMEASAKGAFGANGNCHGILMEGVLEGNAYLTSKESLPLWERALKLLSQDCIAFWSASSLGTQWEILTAIITGRFGLPAKKMIIICSSEEETGIKNFYLRKETSRISFVRTAEEAVQLL